MPSNVTIKNVSWLHFSWATVYFERLYISRSSLVLHGCLLRSVLERGTFWKTIFFTKYCDNVFQ